MMTLFIYEASENNLTKQNDKQLENASSLSMIVSGVNICYY